MRTEAESNYSVNQNLIFVQVGPVSILYFEKSKIRFWFQNYTKTGPN